MAIDVMYIDDGRGVLIRQSDTVTGKEIIAAQKWIYQKHLLKPQQYHIIDRSWCTEYDVTAIDIETIASLDVKCARLSPNMIMAVIESNYLQFNLTDVWQAYIEDKIKYSKSFSNQVEALRWIKERIGLVQSLKFLTQKGTNNDMNISIK